MFSPLDKRKIRAIIEVDARKTRWMEIERNFNY